MITKKYNTDKFDLGYMDHLYNDLFLDKLDSTTKLLEIGVFNGGSALYWKDIFPNADIYALDINHCSILDNEQRINHIVGNAYSDIILNQFENNTFDIIIDDGPHTFDSFMYLVNNYVQKLRTGGLMIIEDIINTKWTQKLIDALNNTQYKTEYKVYDMRLKQKTKHLVDLWKNGLDILVIERK